MTIRRLVEADVPAADRILMSAFQGEESRQVDLLRYLDIQPDGWLLALNGEHPVGMVGAVDYGPFAYLGLMAVDPRVQRQGVGRRLLETLLRGLDERGCPIVLLDATEMGAPLYRKLGFVEDGQTARYLWSGEADPSGVGAGSKVDRRIEPLAVEDLPMLAHFDEPIFGARREKVLAAYLAENPGRAFAARDENGRVAGFLIAQDDRLGPWAARDSQSAVALLEAALTLPFKKYGPRVIVPERNTQAASLLVDHGFELLDLHRHMRRGGNSLPGMPASLYGLASFAIG